MNTLHVGRLKSEEVQRSTEPFEVEMNEMLRKSTREKYSEHPATYEFSLPLNKTMRSVDTTDQHTRSLSK